MSYYLHRIFHNTSFDLVQQKVKDSISKEGFQILTDISIKDLLKEQLNVAFKNYHVFGVFSSQIAHQALQTEAKAGAIMPWNVVVEENDDGAIEVFIVNPEASMDIIGNFALGRWLVQLKRKLLNVLDQL